ncbi:MAG TPA: hypothetical protein VHD34_01415 [Xanthobacteraceae bacterium]|nr:hypothetical protein [Xanthobacteraceae bacterium]
MRLAKILRDSIGRARRRHRYENHSVLEGTMYWQCYLRKGTVYIPTTGRFDKGPLYLTVEPVTVIPVHDTVSLRRAFAETLARGNPKVSASDVSDPSPPVVMKYAGVKTWNSFARHAEVWGIDERNGMYEIITYRRHSPGGWVPDQEQAVVFPAGTTADEVIERMIAILQSAAAQST